MFSCCAMSCQDTKRAGVAICGVAGVRATLCRGRSSACLGSGELDPDSREFWSAAAAKSERSKKVWFVSETVHADSTSLSSSFPTLGKSVVGGTAMACHCSSRQHRNALLPVSAQGPPVKLQASMSHGTTPQGNVAYLIARLAGQSKVWLWDQGQGWKRRRLAKRAFRGLALELKGWMRVRREESAKARPGEI